MSDDLSFDPNERVVPVNTETIRPLARRQQVVPPGTPAVQPMQAPQSNTAQPHTPPAIQARQQPQRQRPPSVAHQIGRAGSTPPPPPAAPPVAVAQAPDPVPSAVPAPFVPPAIRPEKTTTTAFEDTWLPSNFVPYTWSNIQIRRFNIEELRAVVRARVSGNLRHLVRAVDATISRYADELTVGDFWYLMYWHRLNSYKKSPFIIDWTCTDPLHVHSVNVGDQALVSDHELEAMTSAEIEELIQFTPGVEEGEIAEVEYYKLVKKDKQTLRNTLQVSGSNLETDEIDIDKYTAKRQQIEAEYNVDVVPQRLTDLIDSLEQQESKRAMRVAKAKKEEEQLKSEDASSFIEALDREDDTDIIEDEEQAFMHRYAALLTTEFGLKLDDRANYLNALDPDLLVDMEDFLEVAEHGVRESWNVKCKGCSASRTVQQSLDALSFLPSLQRGGLA